MAAQGGLKQKLDQGDFDLKDKILNLTPHAIHIYNNDKKLVLTIEPELIPARLEEKRKWAYNFVLSNGSKFPVDEVSYGYLSGLPEEKEGVIYVVSQIVYNHAIVDITKKSRFFSPRSDLFVVGSAIRNEKGVIIGCVGLSELRIN